MMATLWVVFCLGAWVSLGYWMSRRNDKRLVASRSGMSELEFISSMRSTGVDEDIARSVLSWIAAYYGPHATPHAADRMKADIAIDPDDIGFFVLDFYSHNGLPQPNWRAAEMLPSYNEMTLTSLAAYLTRRRITLRDI